MPFERWLYVLGLRWRTLSRTIATRLYRVAPSDAITVAGATLLLISVATLAAAIPARRAAGVDPLIALRWE